MGPITGATKVLGPYCPGIMPLTTLLAPFTGVISYRSYRLRNTRGEVTLVESGNITRIKRRFDDLYPGFAPFGGSPPIRLLEFVTTLRDNFNVLKASKAVAALLLTCYLKGSAKTLYASQRSSGVRFRGWRPRRDLAVLDPRIDQAVPHGRRTAIGLRASDGRSSKVQRGRKRIRRPDSESSARILQRIPGPRTR